MVGYSSAQDAIRKIVLVNISHFQDRHLQIHRHAEKEVNNKYVRIVHGYASAVKASVNDKTGNHYIVSSQI